MFGKIRYENFTGLTTLPQKAASAWSILENLVGAQYKALLFLGTQVVKGTNYYFIAEQTLILATPIRRVVKVCINEFDNKFELINVEEI